MYRLFKYSVIVLIGMIFLVGCSSSSNEVVTPPPSVTAIQVTPAFATVAVDTEGAMRATAYLSDDSFFDVTTDATWTSSDVSVVQVDSNTGHALALLAGTATLTASYENQSDTSEITVTAVTLDRIDVAPADESVAKDINIQYTATGHFSDGSEQVITPFVVWGSSDPGIASIAVDGLAMSVSPGTTTIEAVYNAVSGSTTLEVTPATLSFLKVLPAETEAVVGTRLSLEVTAYFSDGSEQDVTFSSTWDSSNISVATVSSFGLVSAISTGTAFVTAMFEGVSVNSYITVTPATLEYIEIIPNSNVVPVGRTIQYNARGYFSDNTVQDITDFVTWRSRNGAIATIESGTGGGLATAIGVGFTDIEAVFDRVTQTSRLQVLDIN